MAPPPLSSILPSPHAELDSGARIRVVLGRSTVPAPTPSIVAVEAREEDGRIVGRRVVLSK